MKIDPTSPRPTPGPARLQAAPARPFEDHLVEQQGQAFGFGELGMFGHRARADAPTPNRDGAGPSGKGAPAGPGPDAPADTPSARPPYRAPETARTAGVPTPGEVLADGAPATRATAGVTPESGTQATTVATAQAWRPDQSSPEPGPAAGMARRTARSAPPAPAVSLIVAEQDGAVRILVGSPRIEPGARSLLRRLAEALLSRSGLGLRDFHLNGAPIAPDQPSNGGEYHGPRSS